MDPSLGDSTSVIPRGVEESRDVPIKLHGREIGTFPETQRDPSNPLRSTRDNKSRRGETAAHFELKRLALIWAQENGYPICALEVSLPKCRYRADVAAYRPEKNGSLGLTAIF